MKEVKLSWVILSSAITFIGGLIIGYYTFLGEAQLIKNELKLINGRLDQVVQKYDWEVENLHEVIERKR